MCAHILVVEDDPKQAAAVRLYLEREGHPVSVVHDGPAPSSGPATRRRTCSSSI